MISQVSFQQALNIKFNEIKTRNSSFSVRAFAQQLGIQASAANEILKGQRRVSKKLAEKIADKLKLDPEDRSKFLTDFRDDGENKKVETENEIKTRKLNSDQFELISNWVHFAILSLVKLSDFQSDISWISKRLGVETVDIRKALLRLQHLDLIHIADNGQIVRTPNPVRTTDDDLNLTIQEMHLNDMAMAATKIKEVPVNLRDYTNFTFSGDPKTLPRAKEILRKTQDDLEEIMDKDSSEVYRLCMYLFPLTDTKAKS